MPNNQPPPLPPDFFDMVAARQMALDALRAWLARITMPGTTDDHKGQAP